MQWYPHINHHVLPCYLGWYTIGDLETQSQDTQVPMGGRGLPLLGKGRIVHLHPKKERQRAEIGIPGQDNGRYDEKMGPFSTGVRELQS